MAALVAVYLEKTFNTTSETISTSTNGYIPSSIVTLILRAFATSLLLNVLYLTLTELQHQFLSFWHRCNVLVRVQGALPPDRDIKQLLLASTSVTLPVALYQSYMHDHLASKTVFRFNIAEIIALQVFVFLNVDTWYFWGHRMMHKSKFLWNNVHKHHHEKKNVNVYSTAYAAFVENLVLIAPVIILSMAIYDSVSVEFNGLAWHMAIINQAIIFNIGHCGFRFHPMMHFMILPSGIIHRMFQPFDLSQVPEDHEMHHLYPLCNFSLNFRIWDTLMGSYKSIDHVIAMKEKRGVKVE